MSVNAPGAVASGAFNKDDFEKKFDSMTGEQKEAYQKLVDEFNRTAFQGAAPNLKPALD